MPRIYKDTKGESRRKSGIRTPESGIRKRRAKSVKSIQSIQSVQSVVRKQEKGVIYVFVKKQSGVRRRQSGKEASVSH